MASYDLSDVTSHFLGNIEIQTQPILEGHIHSGWYVYTQHPQYPETVLQKINNQVFLDPLRVTQNIEQVTTYLRAVSPHQRQIQLIKTTSGAVCHLTSDGSFWRMFVRIPNAYTCQIPESLSQVFAAGRTTGLFLRQAMDYPLDNMYIAIPDFHNTSKRYQDFLNALSSAEMNLVQKIQKEANFFEERADQFGLFWDALLNQHIPWRLTHNDTKLDNILFDKNTHQAICLIDLDTLMPGSALFDFGDAMRSMCNPAAEDEADLSRVEFQIPVFRAYTQGYLEAAGDVLTDQELSWLAKSPWMITIENAIRFLTDYLQGNRYYKTRYPHQNLNRCRTHIKLVQDIEKNLGAMESIVRGFLPGN